MSVAAGIIAALGGATKVAKGLTAPVQTVHSWKKKGAIPSWRRPAVHDLARRNAVALGPAALAYLADTNGRRSAARAGQR